MFLANSKSFEAKGRFEGIETCTEIIRLVKAFKNASMDELWAILSLLQKASEAIKLHGKPMYYYSSKKISVWPKSLFEQIELAFVNTWRLRILSELYTSSFSQLSIETAFLGKLHSFLYVHSV